MINKKYYRTNNHLYLFDLRGRIYIMEKIIGPGSKNSDYITGNIRNMTLRKLNFMMDFKWEIQVVFWIKVYDK